MIREYPFVRFEYKTDNQGYMVSKVFGKKYNQTWKKMEVCVFMEIPKIVLLSKPQPNLNTRLGLTIKWHHHHHHPTETQYQQYLSCYWPDFHETLKVGFCKHLEHIPTVWVTFDQATFVLATFVHIRNISAVTDPILMKLYR